jgi:hypothetical protein
VDVNGQYHVSAVSASKEKAPPHPPVPIIQEAGWAPEPVCTLEKRRLLYRDSNPESYSPLPVSILPKVLIIDGSEKQKYRNTEDEMER